MSRILLVSMSAELGGIEKSMVIFLRFLVEEGHEVDLMLWKQRGELLDEIPREVVFIDNPSPGNLKQIVQAKNPIKLCQYIKLKWYTKRHIPWKSFPRLKKEYDIAISYTQDGYSPYYVLDNVTARKKYMWYHHGAYEKTGRKWDLDNKYYQRYDAIVSVSQANKEMLCLYFPDLREKFVVIPNLIDEIQIREAGNAPCEAFEGFAGCKITTVGRLSREKGQLEAIECARVLKEKGFLFRWVFVGDGPEREACLKIVKQYHLENECLFVGAQKNPYKYITAADVYVQLSNVEADPVTIQEALVLGKPIIASDIPAIRKALYDGELGTLCSIINAANVIMHSWDNNKKDRKKEIRYTRNDMVRKELSRYI